MVSWKEALYSYIDNELIETKTPANHRFIIFNGAFEKIENNKLALFDCLKNTSDKYFKIVSREEFAKLWKKSCKYEIAEWIDMLNENYQSTIYSNHLFSRIWTWTERDFDSAESFDRDLRLKIMELNYEFWNKFNSETYSILNKDDETFNPFTELKITKAELRLIRFMIMKNVNSIEDLNDLEVERYLKRTKEFVIKNYDIERVDECLQFINNAWAENGSLAL